MVGRGFFPDAVVALRRNKYHFPYYLYTISQIKNVLRRCFHLSISFLEKKGFFLIEIKIYTALYREGFFLNRIVIFITTYYQDYPYLYWLTHIIVLYSRLKNTYYITIYIYTIHIRGVIIIIINKYIQKTFN